MLSYHESSQFTSADAIWEEICMCIFDDICRRQICIWALRMHVCQARKSWLRAPARRLDSIQCTCTRTSKYCISSTHRHIYIYMFMSVLLAWRKWFCIHRAIMALYSLALVRQVRCTGSIKILADDCYCSQGPPTTASKGANICICEFGLLK